MENKASTAPTEAISEMIALCRFAASPSLTAVKRVMRSLRSTSSVRETSSTVSRKQVAKDSEISNGRCHRPAFMLCQTRHSGVKMNTPKTSPPHQTIQLKATFSGARAPER